MASGVQRRTIYLVDAFALIFQSFYAIRNLSGPTGMPTNALFGFTRDLLYLHEDIRPDYLICVFDVGEPTFRLEVFEEYKAGREEMPEELQVQLAEIDLLLEAMNIPKVGVPGFEADDVIATVATCAEREGMDAYICSSDKDCRQLISDHIKIFNIRKREVIGRDELLEEWGITPEQVVDLQALVGDPVDNIQGVPGIGIKTAAKLLRQFGSIEGILENLDKVPGAKRHENLQASAQLLLRNRQLVRLRTDVPIECDWDAWLWRPLDHQRLLELFRRWGFHRFADQVAKSAEDAAENPPHGVEQQELFSDDGTRDASPAEAWKADYRLVDSNSAFEKLVDSLGNQKRLAVDLETTDIRPMWAETIGFALCCREGEAWYVPVRGPEGSSLADGERVWGSLRAILENAAIAKVNQNIKYDMVVLRRAGIRLQGVAGDSMVADYLLNPGERNRSIQYLARTYLGHEVIPITDLIGKKGPKQGSMEEVATRKVAEYAAEDADVAWRLCRLLESKLEQQGLRELYDQLEIPLIEVLAEMEYNGIRLDVERLQALGEDLSRQLQVMEQEIYAEAGEEFNIGSLKQLRTILFDRLGMPVLRKTGITRQPSTDQETLERLAAAGYRLPALLLEHRRVSKLKGTYVDALPKLVHPETGRLHTSFHQTVTATGRLSSSDPNLQNIPVRSELGGQIRQAFLPAEGWTLISADYSQIELRLLAHFSEDEELLRAFAEDRDIHTLVAAQVYGVADEDVTPEMRRMAKTINFGIIYGMSAYGLAQRLHVPQEEAEAFIDRYFERYPRVLEYQQTLLHRCRERGYVESILGRRRYFARQAIREHSTYRQRNAAEREAINMEIQGSAADLIKTAMLRIHRVLEQENYQTRMLLQIHDELVFEAPPHELMEVAAVVDREMRDALADRLRVPLKVDVSAGPNWLDVEPLVEVT